MKEQLGLSSPPLMRTPNSEIKLNTYAATRQSLHEFQKLCMHSSQGKPQSGLLWGCSSWAMTWMGSLLIYYLCSFHRRYWVCPCVHMSVWNNLFLMKRCVLDGFCRWPGSSWWSCSWRAWPGIIWPPIPPTEFRVSLVRSQAALQGCFLQVFIHWLKWHLCVPVTSLAQDQTSFMDVW